MSPTIQSPAPAFSVTLGQCYLSGFTSWPFVSDSRLSGDITIVCPTEIHALNDAHPDFARINTTVPTILTDSDSHHASQQPRAAGGLGPNLHIPLLADRNVNLASTGVLLRTRGLRSQITMNDLPVGRTVDGVLRLLQAFQFTDRHGEVCPTNWREGGKIISGDPIAKLDYFAAVDGHHENGKVNGTNRVRVA